VRLIIARCEVEYTGRLAASLAEAVRLILIKADGSVCIHADDRAYKPLNWMNPPCVHAEHEEAEGRRLLAVTTPRGEGLMIRMSEVLHDTSHELGVEPGSHKDGVEAELQRLLAEQPEVLGAGLRLVRREHPTAIGPVDLLLRDGTGQAVAVEVKRRAGIDGVEQLGRYLDLLNRDPLLAPVRGVLAAQDVRPQARTLAEDRGIGWVEVDYDALRGVNPPQERLF